MEPMAVETISFLVPGPDEEPPDNLVAHAVVQLTLPVRLGGADRRVRLVLSGYLSNVEDPPRLAFRKVQSGNALVAPVRMDEALLTMLRAYVKKAWLRVVASEGELRPGLRYKVVAGGKLVREVAEP
jgi:hypothetical protein